MIQKVKFDETFGPDEGSDDNYSSQDEMESYSDKDDEWLPWTINVNWIQSSTAQLLFLQIDVMFFVCFVWHA